jgi:adenylate cyclase
VSALAVPLSRIRPCLEGVIPSPFVTCSADGVPNITYLSIVRMVDAEHVGLSFQFFSKTRRNLEENPRAQVIVVDPGSLRQFRLDLRFERSETAGPLFESMRTQLAAIASQTGMAKVFVLRGVDVYRVLACDAIGEHEGVDLAPARDPVDVLDTFTRRVSTCQDLEALFGGALGALEDAFGYASSFLMLADEAGTRLFTIASRGYALSGVGSEVPLGEGLLGVAAQRRTIVRSTNLARDLVLSRAVRASIEQQEGQGREALEREIPLPGLPGALS